MKGFCFFDFAFPIFEKKENARNSQNFNLDPKKAHQKENGDKNFFSSLSPFFIRFYLRFFIRLCQKALTLGQYGFSAEIFG